MTRKLSSEKLYRRCDPDALGFETTEKLKPLNDIIGQERAVRALELGLGIRNHRYNIFVAGDPGTGKTSTVKAFLERVSAKEPRPPDLCYVRNFEDPYRPLPLQLPAGQGAKLRDAMDRMIEGLKSSLPAAFESEEYRKRRQQIDQGAVASRVNIYQMLESEASQRGFAVQRTPIGINVIPIHQGKPLTEEQFNQMPAPQRQHLEKGQLDIQPLVQHALHEVSALEEQRAHHILELNQEAAAFLILPAITKLQKRYEDLPSVVAYLKSVAADLMRHVEQFFQPEEDKAQSASPSEEEQDPFSKYKVNLLVDHGNTQGAPVIVEDTATYPNLFGRMEHRFWMGTLVSDFTLIKPGALHMANGGYLVLSADTLMRNPLSWEGLKIALKGGKISIDDPSYLVGQTVTEGLRPLPIPLDVKVIIVGSPLLYSLIDGYDEDFRKFFNVLCEFSDRIPWKAMYVKKFGSFIKARCQERNLLPFDKTAVARIVEHAARLVNSQRKLSARFSDITVMVGEAVYWAQKEGAKVVSQSHVERAIEEKLYRGNLVEESMHEIIQEGSILVTVTGQALGQVNGLTVYELGDVSFGRPVRITATAYSGKDGVLDIETEAELSGKIHTKSALILKGWFGHTFAWDKPLSLAGGLTFEQTYGPVEGDSASCAELYALISALSGVPINQSIAITGSMNQRGQVQPIGGVNEKIEGFFKVCKAKGLTGRQGVIIPAQNEQDLMLQRDVVEAVEKGRFHLWSIKTVEEGLALLTGKTVGKRARGKFTPGSIYAKVDERLHAFNKALEPPIHG